MNANNDEGKLISGDEAKKAWANGETVQVKCAGGFFDLAEHRELLNVFDNPENIFRLAPRTITINGIEVPAPFEPKDGELFYYINNSADAGYSEGHTTKWSKYLQFGAWRTEEEIKQVVSALRQVFGGAV